MRIVMFYHSLVSDWNHGNAHFLRGVVTELQSRGHEVTVYEAASSWSREHLVQQQGERAIAEFSRAYPHLKSERYQLATLDLECVLDGADLVLVNEWSDRELVEKLGRHRAGGGRYRLLFHDTHHRSVTARYAMAGYRLENYDGVLAFGEVIRERYLAEGWSSRVWTWHEAADVRVFFPRDAGRTDGDVVWVGNWGDEERTAELEEFLIRPVAALGARTRVHGVRYPDDAQDRLARAGVEYAGWVPNYRVPEIFARFRLTLHIPRRPYVEALPGIPTIRVFEALACGIPLVCAPWNDVEHLFSPGEDYLIARDGQDMQDQIAAVLADAAGAEAVARRGRATILARHTCAHRVDQLLEIVQRLKSEAPDGGQDSSLDPSLELTEDHPVQGRTPVETA